MVDVVDIAKKVLSEHLKFLESEAMKGVYSEVVDGETCDSRIARVRLASNDIKTVLSLTVEKDGSFYVDPFGRHWKKEDLDEAIRLLRSLKDNQEHLSYY